MDSLFAARKNKEMPLSATAIQAIQLVKQQIKRAVLHIADPDKELTLTTDASAIAIGAILSQEGRPVGFMSKRLSKEQKNWSAAELEGLAVVEACSKFRHFLWNRPFKIFCDQNGFVQALSPSKGSKGVKNRKFARWRLELAEFNFTIHHLPGVLNTAADALSRISSISVSHDLVRLRHKQFGHPGIARLRKMCQESKDHDSIENLSDTCSQVVKNCCICVELKPRWSKPSPTQVVHATKPLERFSIDFMVGKPVSSAGFSNILTIIDEFSRFPFAFPTRDRSSATVIKCLNAVFRICGPPASIHSDRGPEFFSKEMCLFLSSWGVHQSRTTPYNPTGNSQCERFNGIIWRTLLCTLAQHQADISCWPEFLGEALHSIRSLNCSATNSTPHALLFNFNRRLQPVNQQEIPAGSYAWLRRFVRNKNDTTGELVQIVSAYPGYAVVSRVGQAETETFNWKHLARHPGPAVSQEVVPPSESVAPETSAVTPEALALLPSRELASTSLEVVQPPPAAATPAMLDQVAPDALEYKTRYGRTVRKPDRLLLN